ncbi:hypothetical protein KCU65_g9290, partial [Aureobasidium melanogenum]
MPKCRQHIVSATITAPSSSCMLFDDCGTPLSFNNPDYHLPEHVAQRNKIYNAVASYKNIPTAKLARQAELDHHQADLAYHKAALHSDTLLKEDKEVICGHVDEFEDLPGKVWPPVYNNNAPYWPLQN